MAIKQYSYLSDGNKAEGVKTLIGELIVDISRENLNLPLGIFVGVISIKGVY